MLPLIKQLLTRRSQARLETIQPARSILQERIEYLWHFAQANAGWGQAAIKSAIAFYEPTMSSVANPLIDQVFTQIKSGKLKDAEATIINNKLEDAVLQAVNRLEQDVVAALSTGMQNKFSTQREVFESAVNIFFDTSRNWKSDLILQGSLRSLHDITFIRTGVDAGTSHKGRLTPSDLAMYVTTDTTLMKVHFADNETADPAFVDQIKERFRSQLVSFREKNEAAYLNLVIWTIGPMRRMRPSSLFNILTVAALWSVNGS